MKASPWFALVDVPWRGILGTHRGFSGRILELDFLEKKGNKAGEKGSLSATAGS
jgi:hypothetical protein